MLGLQPVTGLLDGNVASESRLYEETMRSIYCSTHPLDCNAFGHHLS